VVLDAGSLTDDAIVIKSITVDGARVNVVQQGVRNNLQQLLANLRELQSDESPAPADGGKRLIIDRFTLRGASASVFLADLDETREVTLPDIVVSDVGRASNGATAAEAAQQLLRPLLEAALSSAAGQEIKDRAAKKLKSVVGDLFGGDKDTPDD